MRTRSRHNSGEGLGSGGYCVCPQCGERILHRAGVPCQDEQCPACGAKMLREGSPHHQLWKKRHAGEE